MKVKVIRCGLDTAKADCVHCSKIAVEHSDERGVEHINLCDSEKVLFSEAYECSYALVRFLTIHQEDV